MRLLRAPPRYAHLVRPCTPGDGIETISAARFDALSALHAAVAARSGCARFIPASGAASRMFQDLDKPDAAAELQREWRRYAFAGDLARLAAVTPGSDLVEVLRGPGGLAYAALPKGLLAFHAYKAGPRTAFEEHLVESASLTRDARGVCRLHLTVSAEYLERFRETLQRIRLHYETTLNARFEVTFSVQSPATDTLAADAEGEPARGLDGELVLRPSGHGALLQNLSSVDAEVAIIRNIDNVQRDEGREPTLLWSRLLAGRLEELRGQAAGLRSRLRDPSDAGAPADAFAFARLAFNLESRPGQPDDLRREAIAMLDRPIRVCGVVPNSGEPGGGPFWVRGSDGTVGLQIVESAQVDPGAADQRAALAAATHFNPVFMACELAGVEGGRYDLKRYVDPDAAIITRKIAGDTELRVLERPGLWNGAMAGWFTLFVEVPARTFSPVKTLADLLRPEHQPPSS